MPFLVLTLFNLLWLCYTNTEWSWVRERKLCLWLHMLISYNTEPACLQSLMTWGYLSYWPALNETSPGQWGLEGMQVGILSICWKSNGFSGIFSVLTHSTQWYSSVRVNYIPRSAKLELFKVLFYAHAKWTSSQRSLDCWGRLKALRVQFLHFQLVPPI